MRDGDYTGGPGESSSSRSRATLEDERLDIFIRAQGRLGFWYALDMTPERVAEDRLSSVVHSSLYASRPPTLKVRPLSNHLLFWKRTESQEPSDLGDAAALPSQSNAFRTNVGKSS